MKSLLVGHLTRIHTLSVLTSRMRPITIFSCLAKSFSSFDRNHKQCRLYSDTVYCSVWPGLVCSGALCTHSLINKHVYDISPVSLFKSTAKKEKYFVCTKKIFKKCSLSYRRNAPHTKEGNTCKCWPGSFFFFVFFFIFILNTAPIEW